MTKLTGRHKPETKQDRNYCVRTIKGLFWYDDEEHLRKRLKHEAGWLEKLASKATIDQEAIVKQAKFIYQIVDELGRISK